MPYSPPKELQSKPIWTLVIKNSRGEKHPEYYYTRKKIPLQTWPDLIKRYKANPGKYAPVSGIVSDELLVIDIDKQNGEIPENIKELLDNHPTHYHISKSGNGHHIYYSVDEENSLFKKSSVHKTGELYNGAFVTTIDNLKTDFSQDTIAPITVDELLTYMPEIKRFTRKYRQKKETVQDDTNQDTSLLTEHIDVAKVLREAQQLLNKIPVDLDHMLEVAYEVRFKEFVCNSYTHWLMVSHALSHLSFTLARYGDSSVDILEHMFIEWSKDGAGFKSEDDCSERFQRSLEETKVSLENNDDCVTFNALRKLGWAYQIPQSEFPFLAYDKKGVCLGPDKTDPRNYIFVTNLLGLKILRDQISDEVYIQGPKAIVKHYFSTDKAHDSFFTKDREDISVPYQPNYEQDKGLINSLVALFRDFGIAKTTKAQPLTAGFARAEEIEIDPLYTWMSAVPWDKQPRLDELVRKTITLDKTKIPSVVGTEFLYSLIIKQLKLTAGLRAKLDRLREGKERDHDRFVKSQAILILHGYQNTHKSTWVECLVPSETNAVISVPPSNVKDTLEIQRALSGAFILNLDEIDVIFEKMNAGDLKNVITQEKDSFRQMYTQAVKSKVRAASFFGTTNVQQLRLDRTGNRRFWFIPIENCDAHPLVKCDYQQLWAEILHEAEQMKVNEWPLTGQEREWVNIIASQYSKSTKAEKSLELIYDDEMLDHTQINFERFFMECMTQNLKREFVKEKVLIPLKGNKAYSMAKAAGFMKDVDFDLTSFEYAAQDFIGQLTQIKNKVLKGPKWSFREGRLTYQEGNNTPTVYFFFPFKGVILKAITEGRIPMDILHDTSILVKDNE